jgi:hypothetical protein
VAPVVLPRRAAGKAQLQRAGRRLETLVLAGPPHHGRARLWFVFLPWCSYARSNWIPKPWQMAKRDSGSEKSQLFRPVVMSKCYDFSPGLRNVLLINHSESR